MEDLCHNGCKVLAMNLGHDRSFLAHIFFLGSTCCWTCICHRDSLWITYSVHLCYASLNHNPRATQCSEHWIYHGRRGDAGYLFCLSPVVFINDKIRYKDDHSCPEKENGGRPSAGQCQPVDNRRRVWEAVVPGSSTCLPPGLAVKELPPNHLR